jgi:hypothetical protein
MALKVVMPPEIYYVEENYYRSQKEALQRDFGMKWSTILRAAITIKQRQKQEHYYAKENNYPGENRKKHNTRSTSQSFVRNFSR